MNTVVLVIGVLLIAAGLISQFYTQTLTEEKSSGFGLIREEDTEIHAPYKGFALPLVVLGSIVVIAGGLMRSSNSV